MKYTKQALGLLAAMSVSAIASSQAFAVDGTINFSGELTASTCKINGNAAGTQTAVNVTLPTLATSALATKGATAGVTPFALNLTECTGTSAQTKFEIGSTVDSSSGALINQTSGGSNAQIQVLNNQFQKIDLYTNNGSQTVTIAADKTATMQYYAQYLAANAAATPGKVTSLVTFSMMYN
ncbi:fimbrial protein [Trinickia sp. YCB016]